MIKAVIFDMDGLLIDSEPFWRQSHQTVLAGHGYDITEDDVRAQAGRRTLDVAQHWQERFGFDTPSHAELAEQVVDRVVTAIHTHGQPMAGADWLIRELHRHGVPMAMASSSGIPVIEAVLDKLDLRQFMYAVHSAVDDEHGKPFPDVFLSTARSLGVAPTDCLVLEDSLNGVKAAKAAGMRCIAVPEQPYDIAAFKAAGPDRIVASLELIHWADIAAL